jgi:hypothetical protein
MEIQIDTSESKPLAKISFSEMESEGFVKEPRKTEKLKHSNSQLVDDSYREKRSGSASVEE